MHPMIDQTGKIWEYNEVYKEYHCINAGGFRFYTSLLGLMQDHGPLFKVARGEEIEAPFEPIPEGRWVEFNVGDSVLLGRIKSYDDGKLFYEVIVNVGRGQVRESL
jgi:hypothetical protein